MSSPKKLALVLGGGGARGIAHIGVLKVLERAGIKPDMIIGVSMGAIIGAAYAIGRSVGEIEELALSITKRQLARFFKAGPPHKYLIKADRGFNFLDKQLLKEASFADTRIPFLTVATNLATGRETVLDQGRLIDALKASSCVPGIFPPVRLGNDYFIDGGVINPTPTDLARKRGADLIIAVDFVMGLNNPPQSEPNILTTLMQAYEIIRTDAVKNRIAASNGSTVMIEPQMRGAIDSFMFHKMKDFINSGETAAKQALPRIKAALSA